MSKLVRPFVERICSICYPGGTAALSLAALMTFGTGASLSSQVLPSVVDDNLAVRVAASGLQLPTTMAFLSSTDMLVLEKNTGKVQYLVNGAIQTTSIDLSVNNASERGLLGIALDPEFAMNHYVYLYWTCACETPTNPFVPSALMCPDPPALGADSSNILAVPLLGNRVDRFTWNATTKQLAFDRNLIKLHAFQNDGAPTPAGQGDA